jgi:hypothetical protein
MGELAEVDGNRTRQPQMVGTGCVLSVLPGVGLPILKKKLGNTTICPISYRCFPRQRTTLDPPADGRIVRVVSVPPVRTARLVRQL